MDFKEPNFDSRKSNVNFLENVGIEKMDASSAYIVTYTPYFKNVAKRELGDIDESVHVARKISDGLALITSQKDQNDFLEEIGRESPIFLKHIMPVMDAGTIEKNLDKDKEILLNSTQDIVDMKPSSKFAIQCRVIGGSLPYSAKDIEVYIGNIYYEMGNIPTFSDRKILNDDIFIISILIHDNTFYTGFSKSSDNLNFHSDEARIRSRAGAREISRAENKLIEALATFKVELDGKGTALDLGAAPGGWSKVLADYGYNVLAVDPAALHPNLEKNPKITHLKTKSQDIHLQQPLDLIVNDMNMDPQETAKIMNDIAHLLKDSGLAIITLKLPNRAQMSIQEAVKILEKEYKVLKIRSLFHNRQEVTALLQRKSK
jgi:23S rRNA (cytidine2498-2'-O)-methyltransferase